MRIFLSRIIFMIIYFSKALVDYYLVSLLLNLLSTEISPNSKCFTLGSITFIFFGLWARRLSPRLFGLGVGLGMEGTSLSSSLCGRKFCGFSKGKCRGGGGGARMLWLLWLAFHRSGVSKSSQFHASSEVRPHPLASRGPAWDCCLLALRPRSTGSSAQLSTWLYYGGRKELASKY